MTLRPAYSFVCACGLRVWSEGDVDALSNDFAAHMKTCPQKGIRWTSRSWQVWSNEPVASSAGTTAPGTPNAPTRTPDGGCAPIVAPPAGGGTLPQERSDEME